VTFPGFFDAGDVRDFDRRVSFERTAQPFGEFAEFHGGSPLRLAINLHQFGLVAGVSRNDSRF
jgi:hypothetical protein